MEWAYRIYHPNHTFFQTRAFCGTVEKDWLCTVYQKIPCWWLAGEPDQYLSLVYVGKNHGAVTYVGQNYIDRTKSRVKADFVSP